MTGTSDGDATQFLTDGCFSDSVLKKETDSCICMRTTYVHTKCLDFELKKHFGQSPPRLSLAQPRTPPLLGFW